MKNDETQEDVTLENDVEEVEETVEEDTDDSTDAEAELAKARAEAKKWEAIAKRKAKKAEEASTPDTPQSLDQDLINLTYKNYLGGLGITNQSVQDEAISLAKKMGMAVSQLQSDPAIMEILKAKQKVAQTNNAMTKGTGGAALKRKDADYYASKVANGGTLDSISGKEAVELLRKLKGN